MPRQYRPRRARSSPLWQCLCDSLEAFSAEYYPERSKYLGPLDPSRETALHDGTVVDLEPETSAAWMPTTPRYKREPIAASEPGLAQHNETAGIQPLENGLFLEIEDPDPWAHDTEPVFWTE